MGSWILPALHARCWGSSHGPSRRIGVWAREKGTRPPSPFGFQRPEQQPDLRDCSRCLPGTALPELPVSAHTGVCGVDAAPPEQCPPLLPYLSHTSLFLPGCCTATRSQTSPRVSLGDFSPCSCCKALVAGWDALWGHREVGQRSPAPMVQ